jgi:hypothetical protein
MTGALVPTNTQKLAEWNIGTTTKVNHQGCSYFFRLSPGFMV